MLAVKRGFRLLQNDESYYAMRSHNSRNCPVHRLRAIASKKAGRTCEMKLKQNTETVSELFQAY